MNLNEILPNVERDVKDLQVQLNELEYLAETVSFDTVNALTLKCIKVKEEFEDYLGKSIVEVLKKEANDETV